MPPPAPTQVDRVGVRIPPFWPTEPEIWFAQIENQFALTGITSDDTKYNYVTGHLEQAYAAEIRDILLNPPATEKYGKLKAELIARFGISEAKKVRQLLDSEEIGDRKPSQFLRYLRSLGGQTFPDNILRTLWLGKLPVATQAILATQSKASLDEVATLADAIDDATPAIHPSTVASADSRADRLIAEVESLINKLTFSPRQSRPSSRDRAGSSYQTNRRSYTPPPNNDGSYVCWYHKKFGKSARRCQYPCKFQQGNARGIR